MYYAIGASMSSLHRESTDSLILSSSEENLKGSFCLWYVNGYWLIVNPRRTCAGGLRYLSCVCVCVCVCLSVCTPAPTTLVSTLKMRYVGVYLIAFLCVDFL